MVFLTQEITLKPLFSRILAALVVAICVLGEIGVIVYGRLDTIIEAVPAIALVGFGAFALFWAPYVRVGPAAVEIINPLRSYVITWPAILDIQTRWGLTLKTEKLTVSAWASPARSRYASLSQSRRDGFGRPVFVSETSRKPSGDRVPSSVAGLAPMLITEQWERYRDAELLGSVEGEGVTVRWHSITAIILGALVVLCVVGFAIH